VGHESGIRVGREKCEKGWKKENKERERERATVTRREIVCGFVTLVLPMFVVFRPPFLIDFIM
jgi:hypothetical protein